MSERELLIDTIAFVPPARALEALAGGEAERRLPGAPHSIAEIVAHMAFWQDWFGRRAQGIGEPMAATAAAGWPTVEPGSWAPLRERFLSELERTAAWGGEDRAVTPAIEYPPLALYSLHDALVHVAQHNAHHLGQVVLLRQLMGLWPPPSGSWTW